MPILVSKVETEISDEQKQEILNLCEAARSKVVSEFESDMISNLEVLLASSEAAIRDTDIAKIEEIANRQPISNETPISDEIEEPKDENE